MCKKKKACLEKLRLKSFMSRSYILMGDTELLIISSTEVSSSSGSLWYILTQVF